LRRTAQAELWPAWRHFCLITNRDKDIALVEAEHREHGAGEQVADLKDQALTHFPSGHFHANGAWTVLAALAQNLLRWTQLLGLPNTDRPRRPHPAPPAAAGPSAARPSTRAAGRFTSPPLAMSVPRPAAHRHQAAPHPA
jgi:hypothetical protein